MVVLLSGGLDSMVVAERARVAGALVGCVFVDYGHPAQQQEGWRAFAYCGERGVPLRVVHAFGLDLGDMGAAVGARVVPCRNAVLLSVAANAARLLGGTELAIGAIANDQRDYSDCRPEFFAAMSIALGVSVTAPLVAWTKREVVVEAVRLGLRPSDAWSCYGPGPIACGACPSCLERDGALAERAP